MARAAVASTLGAALTEGQYNSSAKPTTPVATATATAAGTLTTNVAAAVAVLVADGATPTQAHVNTLNTAWGLLATAIAAADAAANGSAANFVVDFDPAVITSNNALRSVLRQAAAAIRSSGLVT